jgi:hypothetical protein
MARRAQSPQAQKRRSRTRDSVVVSKPPLRWVEAYWEEDDQTYFFEADEDGWVLRQVVLQGPDRSPTVAASLVEWPDVKREGLAAAQAYFAKYGMTSEKPITEWDFPYVKITRGTFEKVWTRARGHLDAKSPPVAEASARASKSSSSSKSRRKAGPRASRTG